MVRATYNVDEFNISLIFQHLTMTVLLHSCDYNLSRILFNYLLPPLSRSCHYLQTMTSSQGYFWDRELKKCPDTQTALVFHTDMN